MYRPIEIILADDHEIFRDGFAQMIKKCPDIRLVGEAANGATLLELAHQLNPEVVITDIQMPVMDGIEATRRLKKELPFIGIIALSMYNEDYQIVEMIEAGASGYLIKNAHKTEIVAAIKAVNQDASYYCLQTREKLALRNNSPNHPIPVGSPDFTNKEKEIICYICEELSNKDIAEKMKLSCRTVEWHRKEITRKMDVKNTAGIVTFAIKHKLYRIG